MSRAEARCDASAAVAPLYRRRRSDCDVEQDRANVHPPIRGGTGRAFDDGGELEGELNAVRLVVDVSLDRPDRIARSVDDVNGCDRRKGGSTRPCRDARANERTGSASRFADFVQDDVVQMKVISLGSYSYDTQAGGNTTVPLFQVSKITHKGSCE